MKKLTLANELYDAIKIAVDRALSGSDRVKIKTELNCFDCTIEVVGDATAKDVSIVYYSEQKQADEALGTIRLTELFVSNEEMDKRKPSELALSLYRQLLSRRFNKGSPTTQFLAYMVENYAPTSDIAVLASDYALYIHNKSMLAKATVWVTDSFIIYEYLRADSGEVVSTKTNYALMNMSRWLDSVYQRFTHTTTETDGGYIR